MNMLKITPPVAERTVTNRLDCAGALTVRLASVTAAQEEARTQLVAKLQPERIRATLAFAGLYQIAHAMIQQAVLEEVRLFYRRGFDETGWQYDEEGCAAQVVSRAPKSKFRASLLWLVHSDAITLAQADRLDEIYDHRHDLTHELIKYVVDVKFEPDVELLADALKILADIRRFWTQIEVDIGTYEAFGDIDVDEVQPLSLMVLQSSSMRTLTDCPARNGNRNNPSPDGGRSQLGSKVRPCFLDPTAVTHHWRAVPHTIRRGRAPRPIALTKLALLGQGPAQAPAGGACPPYGPGRAA